MSKRRRLQEMESNIQVDKNNQIIYKGVNLGITKQQIQDYKFQTGHDPVIMVEDLYESKLCVVRDKKLKKILDE